MRTIDTAHHFAWPAALPSLPPNYAPTAPVSGYPHPEMAESPYHQPLHFETVQSAYTFAAHDNEPSNEVYHESSSGASFLEPHHTTTEHQQNSFYDDQFFHLDSHRRLGAYSAGNTDYPPSEVLPPGPGTGRPFPNPLEYEDLAETFNPHNEDLLLHGGLLTRYEPNIRAHDPYSYHILRRIDGDVQMGLAQPGYWSSADGQVSLKTDYVDFFWRRQEYLPYTPSEVRNAFWVAVQAHNKVDVQYPVSSKPNTGGPHFPDGKSQASTKRVQSTPSQRRVQIEVPRNVIEACRRSTTNTIQRGGCGNQTAADLDPESGNESNGEYVSHAEDNGKRKRRTRATSETRKRQAAAPTTENRPVAAAVPPKKTKNRTGVRHLHWAWSEGRKAAYRLANPGKRLPHQAERYPRSELHSNCTPATVDIRHLGQHPVTAAEILTFFPMHTLWRAVTWRLWRNGWSENMIVRYIFYVRGINDPKALRATTLAHQIKQARKWASAQNIPNIEVTKYDTDGLDTTRGLHGINRDLENYRLADLADGVQHWPQGDDRQILTSAIELAVATNSPVMLSGYQQYVNDNWNLLSVGLSPMGRKVHKSGTGIMNEDSMAAMRFDTTPEIELHAEAIGYTRL